MNFIQKPSLRLVLLLHLHIFLLCLYCTSSYPTPMNCTDTRRVCTSFLAFKPQPNQTLAVIQSMFDVLPGEITVEGNGWDYIFIRKNCSCAAGMKKYVSNTTLTVKSNGGYVHDLVIEAYDGLALMPNTTRWVRKGGVISLSLFCSCSSGLWNYFMSYVVRDGDSVESLASRFGASMDSIETVNAIDNPDSLAVGSLYYIPLNSVPGDLYPLKNDTPPAPNPSPSVDNFSADEVNHKTQVSHEWIVGGLGVGLALIILSIILCVALRSPNCMVEARNKAKDNEGKISNKLYIFGNPSLFCGCGKSVDHKQTDGESSSRQITKASALIPDILDMDKPLVFPYEEIFSSTDGFSDTNLLGHRTCGSVYYGLLRDQEVAIKRMTGAKTKEFTSEMKVLFKVHHINLVELLGYGASQDEFFLIYEYAQKGSLSSHLHDPQNNGHSPLSWITRFQIALDAARGLEYIHEHIKTRYVHQDIKTSNILLDASFRAKISDFGLAKFIPKTNAGETIATNVVNAYGYLAPEYLSNGLATTKSDVYAFGVILFEIISGKEAIIQTQGPEKRPLASIMLAVLRNSPESVSISRTINLVDPTMADLYPHDCVFKMAMLAKQCVDEDPVLRPDMKQVVISLSQILLSSVEWEATLAGNSQVFSGPVQGR